MTRGHASLLIGALVLMAAGILVSRQPSTQEPLPAAGAPVVAKKNPDLPEKENPSTARRREALQRKGLPELPSPSESPYPPGSPDNGEWIAGRITALQDLAWFDDPESLRKILAELHSPLPEIRAAALEATVDFSSSDAMPYLEVISASTYDPEERAKITEAIEFLKLPTLDEHLESMKSESGEESPGTPDDDGSE